MKYFALLTTLLLLSFTNLPEEKVRTLEAFNELKVGAGITVQLRRGESHSATVAVQSGSESDVRTYVENGLLRVNWKNGTQNQRTAIVELYYVKLNAAYVSAGGKINSKQTLQSENLKLNANSGSKITLDIECNNLDAAVSSGANVSLKGKATTQVIEVSSGSIYDAKDLVSDSVEIDASTGSNAKVHATKNIKAEASTGANIKYTGNPAQKEIEESKYSGGKVKAF